MKELKSSQANVKNAITEMQSQVEALKTRKVGSLGGTAVWRLPLAHGAILETRDRTPCRAPGAWSLLLPLPMSLPPSLSLSFSLSLSLCVTIINKKKN